MVWIFKFVYVKENKFYCVIVGKKSLNGLEFFGIWDEFCLLFGIFVDKVNMDIVNFCIFGEEVLEFMFCMGIGYCELCQW